MLVVFCSSLMMGESIHSLFNKAQKAEARQDYESAYDYYRTAYQKKPEDLRLRIPYERTRVLAAASKITTALVSFRGKPLRSTLGGAGLAISRNCKHLDHALAYARFVASARTQSTLYTHSGGQPGHRVAWLDRDLNAATNNFFANTLPTLDAAWIRPRWPGFIAFQDAASKLVHHYLVHGSSEAEVLSKMNEALATSRK